MKITYRGNKIIKNDYGDIVERFSPIAQITGTINEEPKICKKLEKIDYQFDTFGDGAELIVYVYVSNKEDYNNFKREWAAVI